MTAFILIHLSVWTKELIHGHTESLLIIHTESIVKCQVWIGSNPSRDKIVTALSLLCRI